MSFCKRLDMFSGQNIGIKVSTMVLNNGDGSGQWIGMFLIIL